MKQFDRHKLPVQLLKHFCCQLLCSLMLAAILLPTPLTAQTKQNLISVKVALQWLPQSQFAGFYLAQEKGFYKESGLDVKLIHTGPGPTSLDMLEQNQADFATMFLPDAIVASTSLELVNVAQFFQTSSLMLVAWKDMGIETPKDLHNKKISYWQNAFSVPFEIFFARNNVRPEMVPQNYTINLFLNRGVAACAVMHYNEYHRIYQAGVDFDQLTVFAMKDYDLGCPEDGLYTTAKMAHQNPQLCLALKQGTLRGWIYARSNMDEAVELVIKKSKSAGVPVNKPQAHWMLKKVLESVFAQDFKAGTLDAESYQKTGEMLLDAGLIPVLKPFADFAPVEGAKK